MSRELGPASNVVVPPRGTYLLWIQNLSAQPAEISAKDSRGRVTSVEIEGHHVSCRGPFPELIEFRCNPVTVRMIALPGGRYPAWLQAGEAAGNDACACGTPLIPTSHVPEP